MPLANYNNLSLTIPVGWRDNSIISLVAHNPALAVPLLAGSEAVQANFMLRREIIPDGADADLKILAVAQEQEMQKSLPGFKVVERNTLSLNLGGAALEAVVGDFSFSGHQGKLRQWHVYFKVGNEVFIGIGTGADDASFAQLKKNFVEVVQSLRLREA